MVGQFIRFEDTKDPGRWRVPISPRLLTNSGAMHGGALFAVALEAMELAAGREAVWAVAQFLRHAGPEGVLDVQVDMAVSGSSTTQARASVLVGGVEVLTALGALGCRPFGAEGAWAHRPDVSPPDDLARLTFPPLGGGGIVDLIDVRPSPQAGRPATGRWAAWCRVVDAPAGAAVSVATLAVLADFSVLALGDVLGAPTIGNSVDNTLRVADRGAGDWVLLDVSVEAVHDGFGHLTTHLWGGDDRLLATASQTLILRDADAHGRAVRTTRRIVGAGTVE